MNALTSPSRAVLLWMVVLIIAAHAATVAVLDSRCSEWYDPECPAPAANDSTIAFGKNRTVPSAGDGQLPSL